jgi:Fe-S-cluster containining protein
VTVWCLSIHAHYRCHDSGACCSSGWPIPVEIPLYERLTAALADGSLHTVQGAGAATTRAFTYGDALPEGTAALLGHACGGLCAFYEADARRCRIHRVKGHDSLPIACQQFPRMCLMDARGMRVTLSHYCPTAVDLLFDDTPLAIVENPPSVPPGVTYEGLDARDAFPPLLRPGVLMDWHTLDAFEAHALRLLDAETDSVDAALTRLAAIAERLRAWQAAEGPHSLTLEQTLANAASAAPAPPGAPGASRTSGTASAANAVTRMTFVLQLDAEVRAAVPAGVPHDAAHAPRDAAEAYARWVNPAWQAFTRPLCRYLAAKLFANWCWYQGQGLRTLMRSLEAALAVLRVEAARQTQAHGRMLDRDLLREAFRQTDLLLLHLCSQETLARCWTAAERTPTRSEAL